MAGGQRESMKLRRVDGGAGLRPNTYMAREINFVDVSPANGITDGFVGYVGGASSITYTIQTTGGPVTTAKFQRAVGTFTATAQAFGTVWQQGSAFAPTATPGQTYGVGIYIKSPTWDANAIAVLKVQFLDASNAIASEKSIGITPTSSWQYLTVSDVAPSTAKYLKMWVYASSIGSTPAITLDASDYRVWQGGEPLSTTFDSALRSDFYYIPLELREGQANMVVQDAGYSSVRISYDPATLPVDSSFGPVLEAVIIRSGSGIPQTNIDGTEISRYSVSSSPSILNGGWLAVIDSKLAPGSWYYYGLFAKYFSSGNTMWLRVGEASVLLPKDYGYQDRFWSKVPEWYRRMDREGVGSNNTLERVVKLLGYEFDLHRTYAATLGDLWNLDYMSARLLEDRGDSLAQPLEKASGDKRFRNLIGNLIPLRKSKGTALGVAGYLTALTGYKCITYVGPNMLLSDSDATAKNTTGNWEVGGTSHTMQRFVSTGTGTGAFPPTGDTYVRFDSTATTTMIGRLGSLTDMRKNVPVVPGKSYVFAGTFSLGSGTQNMRITFKWFDKSGGAQGSNVVDITNGFTTPWVRRNTAAQTAPANGYFLVLEVTHTTGTVPISTYMGLYNMILVDTSWRPTGVPGKASTVPLSGTNPGQYDDTGYWERPRRIWINLYPQRVNLATNSDFTLFAPNGGWVAADVPTYDLIRRAYATYTAINGTPPTGEISYDDLRASLNPLSGNWTVDIDPTNQRMVLDTGVSTGPWYMQASGPLFPIHSLTNWSAAAEMSSTHPSTRVRLSIRWYSANSTGNPILDASGQAVATLGRYSTPGTTTVRAEIRNAAPPVGATYGRLIIEAVNDVADHTTYVQRVLIENNPIPGPYFNGSVTDGDYGDFFYIGASNTTFSAYYMSYKSFVTGVGGTDRIMSLMTELLPPTRDYKIIAANTGLYS